MCMHDAHVNKLVGFLFLIRFINLIYSAHSVNKPKMNRGKEFFPLPYSLDRILTTVDKGIQ